MRICLILLMLLIFYSCGRGKHEVVGPPEMGPHALTSIEIVNNQLILEGSDLDGVKTISITGGGGFSEIFSIESGSFSMLVLNGLRDISFTINSIYDLVVTDAYGASSYSITFELPDSSVTAAKLDDMDANTGEFLQWNGSSWTTADLNGLTYLGNWDADTNDPDLTGLSPDGGHYYIVSVAGTSALGGGTGTDSWSLGDWAIYNEEATRWEKISNSTGVISFNSRTGIVTPQTNDYTWAQIDKTASYLKDIADVNIASTPSANQVLMWDDTNSEWDPADIDSVITDTSDLTTNSLTTSAQSGLVINPYNTGAGQTGEVQFKELAASGTNYVALKSPDSLSGNFTFTLPDSYGTNGQFLQTNGSGGLAWADTSSGGGSDDLGDHTATQNIQLGNYYLSGDGGDEGIRVNSSGNVGIGTATPATLLDVEGTVQATAFEGDGSSITGITSSSVTDNSLTVDDLNFASTAGGINIPQLASDPATAASTSGQTFYNTSDNSLKYFNGSIWSEITGYSLNAADGSPSGVLYVNNDGNVGIGTTTPAAKLEVVGDVEISGTIQTGAGQALKIRYGSESTPGGLAIQTGGDFGTVSFGYTFSSAPVVTITTTASGNYLDALIPSAINITTTGFDLYLFNTSTTSASSGTYTYNWIAIGP